MIRPRIAIILVVVLSVGGFLNVRVEILRISNADGLRGPQRLVSQLDEHTETEKRHLLPVDDEIQQHFHEEDPVTSKNVNGPLGMSDWPLSEMDKRRKTNKQGAKIPMDHAIQPIECPECRSILAGAADGTRILLLGHDLQFAGGDIWLLNLARILEHSGAIVRFLFLCQEGPLLSEHQGLSYLFAQNSTQVAFQDFDIVLANTVVIESQNRFFEKASGYLTSSDMDALLKKTFYWIHEYDPERWNSQELTKVVNKVGRVLFDSHAGRSQWIDSIDNLMPRSNVIWPGISLQRIQQILKATGHFEGEPAASRSDRRHLLNIPATNDDDVVVLQVSTIMRPKGSQDLVHAFQQMVNSLPRKEAQKRGWFLILLGSLEDRDVAEFVQSANDGFLQNNFRSRILIQEPTMDVASYYATADLHVLNSICENFGMVLAEAMLAGVPNIARACGGPMEIVDDGETGFLLRNTDDPVSELASLLRKLTTGRGWRENLRGMGHRASIVAKQKFSHARFAREMSNVIGEHLYFSGAEPMWTCSSSEQGLEPNSPLVVERSHGDQTRAAVPALPSLGTYDIGCATVGSTLLFIFGGYTDLDHVSKRVEYYNVEDNSWQYAPPLPEDAAESHQASTADERYIYSLSGQRGAQCHRPVVNSYVYDTQEKAWKAIPSVPVARYGGCAALLNGRLHFVGGLDIDRRTPKQDHYSLSLEELHSYLEHGTTAPIWRAEPDLPYGSGHVYCQVLSSSAGERKLYYFGGETEDYYAQDPSNGDFTCVQGIEYNNPFVFVYDGAHWERGSDMPFAVSHTEGSSFQSSLTTADTLFFAGSSFHEKEVAGDIPVLSDGMYWFHAPTEEFKRIGSMYPIGLARKGTCGLSRLFLDPHDGKERLQVVVVGGQASVSRSLPWAGPIVNFAMMCESTSAMTTVM